MERRRGDSYLGRDFSEPAGLPEDVHVKQKMECVDCHQTGQGGMGHIERRANCQDCHPEVEQAMAKNLHKNLSCEACHVKVLGGYEMTSWGVGKVLSKPSPFKKYSLYYGPQEPPVLVKDQKGIWIPVKIWPNSMGGFKEPVPSKQGLMWRWPGGETRDAFVQLGTFSVPGGNNNYLAWLQVEQVAHPLGRSRTCQSCHANDAQVAKVTWEYLDNQGAEPFKGSQTVVADKDGLRVVDIKAVTKMKLLPDGRTTEFAAWRHLGDVWKTSGDFSIPRADRGKYQKLEKALRGSMAKLVAEDTNLKAREAAGEDLKKLRRKWKEAKAAAAHEHFFSP